MTRTGCLISALTLAFMFVGLPLILAAHWLFRTAAEAGVLLFILYTAVVLAILRWADSGLP